MNTIKSDLLEMIITNYHMKRFTDNLKKDGYCTGLTYFPGIDMWFFLPKNRFFKNDGVVENIGEQTQRLDNYFMNTNKIDKDYSKATGACYNYNRTDGTIKVSTISIKDIGSYANKLNYGHESVHAIRNLGLEDQFIKKLKDEGLSTRPLSEYEDEEVIASLGSIIVDYSLKKFLFLNDLSIKKLYNIFLKNPEKWNSGLF